jgi:hypothetical protein
MTQRRCHGDAIGLVGKVGIVPHEPLKGAHDLFAPKVGWRTNNFFTSESAGSHESAGEGACDDLGDRRQARVIVLPTRERILRRGIFRAGSNALCRQGDNHDKEDCPHRYDLRWKLV